MAAEILAIEMSQNAAHTDPAKQVESALGLLDHLSESVNSACDFSVLRKLFDMTNTQLFLKFEEGEWGKRKVQKLSSGVITFGDTPPPIQKYQGKTGRHALKEAGVQYNTNDTPSTHHGGGCINSVADEEGDSLGNVSRGDRI